MAGKGITRLIAVITVPESALEPLREDEVFCVRSLTPAEVSRLRCGKWVRIFEQQRREDTKVLTRISWIGTNEKYYNTLDLPFDP